MSIHSELPRVEAIVVTWNKKEDVLRLLEQLQGINYPHEKLEIVLVDNNSNDGTTRAVENSFPEVILIKNGENLGGAGGFNAGMRWTLENRPGCEFLWLLDNDVLVDDNALMNLVEVLKRNPEAAVCGSKIVDIANRSEVIEIGAFIDYDIGGIRSNVPEGEVLADPDKVFQVDYVAACSLLARTEYVEHAGLWHEHLFIYWDDMEWGARFNAVGHTVLASNGSIVYHPSWAQRTMDNTAIWRCYYRTRNALWFFNNYCYGTKRRLLLMRMLLRSLRDATSGCLAAYPALSLAFLHGIDDFLRGQYGKKDFDLLAYSLTDYLKCHLKGEVCVFLVQDEDEKKARVFMNQLLKQHPTLRLRLVIPREMASGWKELCPRDRTLEYIKSADGSITIKEKIRVARFLLNRSWTLLITPPMAPKMGTIWGRDVARVNFDNGDIVAIERMELKKLCRIPFLALSFFLKVLFFPPRKERDTANYL